MIDFSGLISQLLSIYWWLVPLSIVAALFESAWFKGFIGEVMASLSALLFLDKKRLSPDQKRYSPRKSETAPFPLPLNL